MQTTSNLTVYATSNFLQHSLVSTIYVVQGVVNGRDLYYHLASRANGSVAVIKPPMAKVANVFGRLEAFTFSVFLYCIGYIQQAGSNNVKTFASAQIFYSAGSTGLQILIQIFVADTTDLLNRALFSSLPDVPFLVTTWIGSPIAQNLLSHTTWRWGYGLWAIVLPVAFLPLALSLILNGRKAAKLNILPPGSRLNGSIWKSLVSLWYDLDVGGLLLLSAGISLLLLPLTLAQRAKGGWHNGSMIAMVVLGCVFLVAFPLWETSPKLAPKPFLPLHLFRNRTVVAGCAIGFFYFGKQFLSSNPQVSRADNV